MIAKDFPLETLNLPSSAMKLEQRNKTGLCCLKHFLIFVIGGTRELSFLPFFLPLSDTIVFPTLSIFVAFLLCAFAAMGQLLSNRFRRSKSKSTECISKSHTASTDLGDQHQSDSHDKRMNSETPQQEQQQRRQELTECDQNVKYPKQNYPKGTLIY